MRRPAPSSQVFGAADALSSGAWPERAMEPRPDYFRLRRDDGHRGSIARSSGANGSRKDRSK